MLEPCSRVLPRPANATKLAIQDGIHARTRLMHCVSIHFPIKREISRGRLQK